jgi:phage terminase large subunit
MGGKIKVQKPYRPLYKDKEKFIILITGGRGSGKSFNAATFIERLTFQIRHIILMCRYTLTAASISVIPEFEQKIELDGFKSKFKSTKTEILNKFSGSKILFRGIKTSSGNQTANLKSIQGITTFVGDEMEEWQEEEDYDTLRLSIRQKDIQNRCILIMNPSDGEHFVYKKYIENTHKLVDYDGVMVQISTHPDVLHIHTTFHDNAENLGDQFINEVARIKEESIKQATINGVFNKAAFQMTKYALKIIGRWSDIAEGVILPNWEEGEFNNSLPYAYGQDYGFSVDPDTLIKVAVDRKRMLIYLDEEYCDTKQLGLNDLYEINKSRIRFEDDLIVGDSAEDRLIEDLRKLGLNIIECEKGPGSVKAGLTAMNDYKIIVTERSVNIKKELRKYKWNDKKAGLPIDKWNHTIDAARYAFRKLTEGQDSDLSVLSVFG